MIIRDYARSLLEAIKTADNRSPSAYRGMQADHSTQLIELIPNLVFFG